MECVGLDSLKNKHSVIFFSPHDVYKENVVFFMGVMLNFFNFLGDNLFNKTVAMIRVIAAAIITLLFQCSLISISFVNNSFRHHHLIISFF